MRDHGAVLTVRVIAVVAAVAACAWFALGVRSSHEADRVSSALEFAAKITPAQARADDQALHEAAVLDPDQTLEMLRAEVALHAGHHADAVAIAERVTEQEPQNPDAWLLLKVVSAGADPALNRLAGARLAQLVPPVPNS